MLQDAKSRTIAAIRFRALGDETRLLLLAILKSGERTVAELMSVTGLGQSLVSHHLRILRQAGLARTRREGRWIHYSIAASGLAAARQALNDLG